jgi:hypothetical protein
MVNYMGKWITLKEFYEMTQYLITKQGKKISEAKRHTFSQRKNRKAPGLLKYNGSKSAAITKN